MPMEESWQQKARCRDNFSHLFFPKSLLERKDERDNRERRAQAVCRACIVQQECLDYALNLKEPYGIWGGRTEVERRQILAAGYTK